MNSWSEAVLVVCAIAVTLALVGVLLALRQTFRRVAGVLQIVEQELRPLIGQANGLTEETRNLVREAGREVERLGEVTDRVTQIADGLARVVSGLSGLARVGQLVTVAAGVRRGVDVFVHRLVKEQGDHHG